MNILTEIGHYAKEMYSSYWLNDDIIFPWLRILTGKKHCQIKFERLQKSANMGIWVVGASNQLFLRGC